MASGGKCQLFSCSSPNFQQVFEENLQRVGRMVALLDHWDQPAYLSRTLGMDRGGFFHGFAMGFSVFQISQITM